MLYEALTHCSAIVDSGAAASYERLEFLGDRVLGLVIADMLLDAFPGEPEGDIARRFTALTRRDALLAIARKIELGRYLVLGSGEDAGRESPAVLADAMEAVIAALYRDAGLESARAFITTHWRAMMKAAPHPPQDAKTRLQEWAQARALALPDYVEMAREGPQHAPRFAIEVRVGPVRASGSGDSKREAEQAAAAAAFARLKEGAP